MLQRVGFEIRKERQGLLLNQEKWLKNDKAPEKPIETTTEPSFTSLSVSRANFLEHELSSQVTYEVARGPAPYKNRTKDCLKVYL